MILRKRHEKNARLPVTLALAPLALAFACAPTQNPADPDQAPDVNYNATAAKDAQFVGNIAAVDNAVAAAMAGKFPGVAIGIIDGGEIAYLQGYGQRSLAPALPFTKTTVHGLGSVSKPLTATAILRLQELGKLDIDDPFKDYIPHAVPVSWNGITIRQLLSHNGGFYRDPNPGQAGALSAADIDASFGQNASQHPRYAMWEFIFTTNGSSDPAWVDTYRYSNVGYTLLGAVVDFVTLDGTFPSHQQGYERFVWSQLARPHGPYIDRAALTPALDHSWRQGDILEESKGYTVGGGAEIVPNWSGWQGPSGGWSMTIGDLARYLAAFHEGDIVSTTTRDDMLQVHTGPGEEMYSLGFFRAPRLGRVAYAHGGVIDGYRCQLTMFPNDDFGVVAFGNADTHGIGAIADAAASAYLSVRGQGPGPVGGRGGQTAGGQASGAQQGPLFELSRDHALGVQRALSPWVQKFGEWGAAKQLMRSVASQSSLGNLLVNQASAARPDLNEVAKSFLGVLRRDGYVGPYRPRK